MRNPKGNWSKTSVAAIRKAEEMQQMALTHINDAFSVETDEVDIQHMTFGDFVRALQTAENNGTREEFEDRLALQLLPMIQSVMAQSQQAQQGGMPPQGGAPQQ